MRHAFLTIAIALFIFSCRFSKNDDKGFIVNDITKARIDSTLKSLVDSGSIAGVSALIFEKDKEVYFNAFGYANREAKVPMDRTMRREK